MKLNCKIIPSAALALILLVVGSHIQAQHRHKHPHAHQHAKKKVVQHRNQVKVAHKVSHKQGMGNAISVIKRTNHVIVRANQAVKKHKVYKGYLSRAVYHQRFAKSLLKQHKTHRAMQHSRLARNYAFKATRSNKQAIDKTYMFSEEENKNMGATVSDVVLKEELEAGNPGVTFDDAAITDKEMTELEVLDVDPSDYKNE